jgi:hypothetical protein
MAAVGWVVIKGFSDYRFGARDEAAGADQYLQQSWIERWSSRNRFEKLKISSEVSSANFMKICDFGVVYD